MATFNYRLLQTVAYSCDGGRRCLLLSVNGSGMELPRCANCRLHKVVSSENNMVMLDWWPGQVFLDNFHVRNILLLRVCRANPPLPPSLGMKIVWECSAKIFWAIKLIGNVSVITLESTILCKDSQYYKAEYLNLLYWFIFYICSWKMVISYAFRRLPLWTVGKMSGIQMCPHI